MAYVTLVGAVQALDLRGVAVVQLAEVVMGKLCETPECDIDLADGRSYRAAVAFDQLMALVDPTGERGAVFNIETPWATEREWRSHGLPQPSMDDREAFARMTRRLVDEGLLEQRVNGGMVEWRSGGPTPD